MPRLKPVHGPVAPLFTLEGNRLPVIAIIGRPNVGKSTLFNRILGTRAAIVDDVPGVTRDRNYADSTYRNRRFRLVDTGGLDPTAHEGMLSLIRQQSQLAIAEADILVLVLDARAGLTPPDEEVVRTLRGTDKPVFLVINKIDTPKVDLPTFGRPTMATRGISVGVSSSAGSAMWVNRSSNNSATPVPCSADSGYS